MNVAEQQRSTTTKTLVIATILVAATALAYAAYAGLTHSLQTFSESKIPGTPELVIHEPENVLQALAALELEPLSDNKSRLTASVWRGDHPKVIHHIHNIATQKGWYPHSAGKSGIKIILPDNERAELEGIETAPYTWIAARKDDPTPIREVSLGKNPAHVTVETKAQGAGKALLGLFGGLSAAVCALAALAIAVDCALSWNSPNWLGVPARSQ